MTDILGPANGTAVATRIAESRAFPVGDTWFKPCTNPASQDGTQIQSVFLNGLLAQLRAAIRGNGKMADGVTPVIAENNGNDAMLLGAIQALIQRGQTTFAVDTGTSDALVIAPSPAVAELKAGTRFVVLKNPLVSGNATTTPTIAISGLQPLNIVKPDASTLGIGDLKKAVAFELLVDGAGNARLVSLLTISDIAARVPTRLTGNTTLYVNAATGSDAAGTLGTSAAPFKTVNAALLYAKLNIDLNGYNLVIQAQDCPGTPYAPFSLGGPLANSLGLGGLTIQGNATTPTNTTIDNEQSQAAGQVTACVSASGGAQFTLGGFALTSGTGSGVISTGAGTAVNLGPGMAFGACHDSHMLAAGGSIGLTANYTISGGATYHYSLNEGNIGSSAAITATVLNTPAFTTFANVTNLSNLSVASTTYSGAATGQRFLVNQNALISAASATSFPGNVAGSRQSGGTYSSLNYFSNGATGYRRGDDGYTRQWGFVSGGNGDVGVVFPLAFANNAFTVTTRIIGRATGTLQMYDVQIDSVSATGFAAGPRSTTSGSSTVNVANQNFYWSAEGYVTP